MNLTLACLVNVFFFFKKTLGLSLYALTRDYNFPERTVFTNMVTPLKHIVVDAFFLFLSAGQTLMTDRILNSCNHIV